MNFFGSSKSRTAPTDVLYQPPHAYGSYESFSSDYIPQYRVKGHAHSNSQSSLTSHSSRSSHYSNHSRSSSSSSSSPNSRPRRVSFSHPEKVVYPVAPAPAVDHHRQRLSTYKMQAAGYSPQMTYAVPAQAAGYYYGTGGQVVYAATAVPAVPTKVRGMPNDSPLSQHREDLSRGRPRSSTAVEAVPMVAHGPASSYSSHEDRRPRKLFGSFIDSIRSRSKSKSRERDSVIPSSHSAKSSISSHPGAGDEHRGRRYEREMRQDVASEIARRMEKDLRLSDFEDPYRTLRRDRSLSQDSTHSARSDRDRGDRHERERERMNRRFRDISPDVQDNTMYNARYLKYNGSPVMPTHPASSGYHTDAQPHMLRRSSTSAAHVTKSRPIPASHASHTSHATERTTVGWFNRRGDELVRPGTIIRQPPEREYPSHLKRHPDVGTGFMDSKGNVIDANCRLIKRVG